MLWAEADVRRAFDQFGSDPEANGSDGSSFVMNLTVFGIPTPVTGARKAIGSKLRCFRTGTDQRTCTVNVSLETKKFTRLLPGVSREKPRELGPEGQHTGKLSGKIFCRIFASSSATRRPSAT